MDQDKILQMVGKIHLDKWGNYEKAAQLVGDLATYRASLIGDKNSDASGADIQNIMLKLCDFIPNKPPDFVAVIAELRPLLLSQENPSELAKNIFSQEFIKLEDDLCIKMFTKRANFFFPNGDMTIFDSEIAKEHGINIPFDGKSYIPKDLF